MRRRAMSRSTEMVDDRLIVISLSKPLRSRGNCWKPISRVLAPNPLICRRYETFWTREQLLGMQKVVGSNPIRRFRKGLHLQTFSCAAAARRLDIPRYE